MGTMASAPIKPKRVADLTDEDIAAVCHEVNRAYCRVLGDLSIMPWDMAPDWQRESALAGVKCQALSFHERGDCIPADELHAHWLEHKRKEGWKYGPVKDEVLKEHPCMVPYNKLPRTQRVKDHLFGDAAATLIQQREYDKGERCRE